MTGIAAKQSTALTLIAGPILDSTGAEYTGAVIGDLSISKNGGTLTALAAAATLTHVANGQYTLVLTTGNTDTLGTIQVTCNKSTYQMRTVERQIVPANVYDAVVAGSDVLQVDVTQLLGDGTSATDLKDFADAGYDPATNKVQGVVLVDTVTTYTGNTPQTGDSFAIANSGTHGNAAIKTLIDAISGQVTSLNNLSAKANWFGYPLLEVPDSGTRAYVFELVIKDDEDKLANLDGLPTIALVNAAGTDRSSLITTGVANPSTGRYTITITVGTATVNESLKLTASGTISAEARYAVYGTQVVDYDTATLINTILTRIGTPASSVSADIAAVKADTAATLLDTDELQADWADEGRLDLILDANTTKLTSLISNTTLHFDVAKDICVPMSSTKLYAIVLTVLDHEGNAEALDSTPTISCFGSPSGTDYASRVALSTTSPTGNYVWAYTSTAGDTAEMLLWTFSVVEGGKTRSFYKSSSLFAQNASQASVNDIQTDVDANTGYLTALTSRITATLFSGVTSLGDWLRRAFRKDAGTAGMTTAASEINTGGTSTYTGTTDNLEAIKDSAGGSAPSAADVADAVWDELLSGHNTVGSAGNALSSAGSAADPWLTLLPGSYTSGMAGYILGTEIPAIQSSLSGLTVTVTGYASIDTDGVLQLKRAHTATLTFTSDSSNLVPDLSVANTKVFLGVKDAAGREWLSLEGTVLVATGLQSVRFTISATLAAAIPKGTHFFDVIAVYGYNSANTPPYTSLVPFTSGRANVTDIYLNPLDL